MKALVILKTLMFNVFAYCIGHNSALGRSLGFEEGEVNEIWKGYASSDCVSAAEKAAIH